MSNAGEQGARGFAAGVLIGLAIVTPVFAATTPGLEQWALPFMVGATTLLVVGLILAALGLGEIRREAPPEASHTPTGAMRGPAVRKERRAARFPSRQLG